MYTQSWVGIFCGLTVLLPSLNQTACADDPSWRIVAAGVFESLDKSVIKCEFTYQRGIAMSPQDAAVGKFVDRVDGKGKPTIGDLANGLLVKREHNVRYRLMYETPTDYARRDSNTFSIASFDFGGAESKIVMYYPRQRNIDNDIVGGTGSVLLERRMETWQNLKNFAREAEYSWLYLPLGLPGGLLTQNSNSPNLPVTALVSERDSSLRFQLADNHEDITYVDVKVDRKYPAITKIESKYQVTEFADFTNLNQDTLFPLKVTTVVGPYEEESPSPFWVGHLWKAKSITNEVTDGDFDIVFEGNDKSDAPQKTVNVIELSSSNDDHLLFDNVNRGTQGISVLQNDTQREAKKSVFNYSTYGFAGLGVTCLFGLLIYWLVRKSSCIFMLLLLPMSFGCSDSISGDLSPLNESNWNESSTNIALFDFGTVYTLPNENNLKIAKFSFKNEQATAVQVRAGESSCSCTSLSIGGERIKQVHAGESCDVELSIEFPVLPHKNFVQTAKIYLARQDATCEVSQPFSIRAHVFPRLYCANLPEDAVFKLNSSGVSMARLIAYGKDPIPDNSLVEFDESKVTVTLKSIEQGIEDGVHFRVFDVTIQRSSNCSTTIKEKVQVFLNQAQITVVVIDLVKDIKTDQNLIFFRGNEDRKRVVNLEHVANRSPIRVNYDNALITVDLARAADNTVLTIGRCVEQSFETQVSVWLAGNASPDPDLVIPVYCLK